jgi:DENN domain-containing protein 4
MEQLGLPFHDQMCFRLVMQLCGENNHPEIAVQILRKMFRLGIVPNAITYKIYHRSLLQVNQ